MIFDNGATTIDFDPVACQHTVKDFTELLLDSTGSVIAAAQKRGLLPQRTRKITLDRTTAELAILTILLTDSITRGGPIDYTDEVGRVWNASVTGAGEISVETRHSSVGHHRAEVELLLESVKNDAGRIAYTNTDVSQMSIQKAGDTELFFPVAYQHPLNFVDVSATRRQLRDGFLQRDLTRFTTREEKILQFSRFPREFMSELDDYYVDTLVGAQSQFTLDHFRDGVATYRIIEGINFTLGPELTWSGRLNVRQEI